MKKLIIVTGISGSGKTTICQKMRERMGEATFISVDTIKESLFEILGYHSREQKERIKTIGWEIYEKLLKEAMEREDAVIMVEYPFREKWNLLYQRLIQQYGYEAMSINLVAQDFDTIWKKKQERDISEDRHIAHELSEEYIPSKRNLYSRTVDVAYETAKQEYETGAFTNLHVGKVVNVTNTYDDDLETLYKQLELFIQS